jgi:RHS repeat-associated protein
VVYDTRNFIKTWEGTAPETDANNLITRALADVKHSVTYFDGLGKPEQTVIKKGSLSSSGNTDLVSPMVYDAFGREAQKYLPYVSTSSDGSFKTNALTEQNTFYAGTSSPIAGQGETFFYGKTDFEASPLNRVMKTYAPGNNWVGANKGIEAQYLVNTLTDAVRVWTVADVANNFGDYSSTSVYGAGELYKNMSVDEHEKKVIEYKDKEGQIILKKVQIADTPGEDHTGWLCTYYIYDDLNQLRAVIQPKAVEAMPEGGWSLATTQLDELCFRYEYDKRGRMIMKKVPGAGAVWMVYDRWDRLVLTQDGNQRPLHNWNYIKYDIMNRPIITGLHHDPGNITLAQINAHLEEAQTWQIRYESENATTTGYTLTQTYPYQVESSVLTVTHYDNYTNLPSGLYNTLYSSGYGTYLTASPTSPDYAEPITASTAVKGMVTWTKVKVLGTADQFNSSVNIYDAKGRVIQVQTINVTGGLDVITNQYSFSNQVLRSHVKHQKLTGTVQTYDVATKNNYDDLGRVISIEKNLNNTGWKAISSISYDALGQLKTKKLAPAFNSNAGLETLTHDYNIRGWMLGTNRDYLRDKNTSGYQQRYFGFELGYDKTTTTPGSDIYTPLQYNGNISGNVWKSAGDEVRRKYNYEYDEVNRLGRATFYQTSNAASGGSWNGSDMNFTVHGPDVANGYKIKYDANGNILTMWQHGWKLGTPDALIDILSYNYYDNSNKLKNVVDAGQDKNTKLGDFRYSTLYENTVSSNKSSIVTDYTYDSNGNLVKDLNKDIETYSNANGIEYNHLNLPIKITIRASGSANKGTITYTYDATGNKLKKVVNENGQDKTTLYLFGVYENDVLQFLPQEEGRIRPVRDANGNITTFTYDYFIKDHLGNVRMVLTEEQKQDQYPAATLEGNTTSGALSMINYEKQFYTIDNTKITAKTSVPGFTTSNDYQNNNGNPPPNSSYPSNYTVNSTSVSENMYKVNATTNKTGLGIVLKVMAGDKIDIHGKSYYQSTQTYNNSNSTQIVLADIISAFIGSPDNAGIITKGATSAGIQTVNNGLIPSTFFRGTNGESTTVPKAYINYIFFDEQFKYAGGNFSRVGASGTVKNHWFSDVQLQNIVVPKNGYIYVYVSNESNADVFFDNLQIFHTKGPILEETHYYPFGLTMAGISSQAANTLTNKYKFGGKELQSNEFTDGSGLVLYDFQARNYDPQVGRWWSGDPKSDKSVWLSPYNYCLNNPIRFFDPDGKFPYPIHIRAFIPVENLSFFGSYKGDGRGYSTTLGKGEIGSQGVTSRMQQVFTVDPSKASIIGGAPWADRTYKGSKSALATPEGGANAAFAGGPTVRTANVDAKMSSPNPLPPALGIAPDIDVKSSIRLTENLEKGVLSVDAMMKGDRYPAAEMFIGDTKGQQLMVIASPFEGTPANLFGDGNRQMGNAKFDIQINKKGEFMGVTVGSGKDAKIYSVDAWNKQMKETQLEIKRAGNSPPVVF